MDKPDFDGRNRIKEIVAENTSRRERSPVSPAPRLGDSQISAASGVKRWRVKWDETEIPDGDYVRAADYDVVRGILDRLVACDTSTELGQIITGKAAVQAAREYVALRKAERSQADAAAEPKTAPGTSP